MTRPTDRVPPPIVERIKELYLHGALPGDIAKADWAIEHGVTWHVVMGLAKRYEWVRPKSYDLAAVKRDFSSGRMSDREICEKHGIDPRELKSAVLSGNWTRELAKRIQDRAQEQVAKEVAEQVAAHRNEVTEDAIVEANALVQVSVVKHHRSGASEARATAMKLMAEMGALAIPRAHLEQFIETAAALHAQRAADDFDGQDKIREQAIETFLQLIGLGSRASTLKNLVGALTQAIELERKVYGIKEEAQESDLAKALRELAGDG